MINKLNILVTSVGNLSSPIIQRKIKEEFDNCKIIGVDIRCHAHGLFFCDKKYLVSKLKSESYLNEILSLCKEESINVIFPLSTIDQNFYSKHKATFKKLGIKVIVSDYYSINIANDKLKLYEFLNEKNIASINYIYGKGKIINEYHKFDDTFVLKKSSGTGGNGIFIVSKNINHLRQDDRKFFLNYDIFVEKKEKCIEDDTILCEYLDGDEYSVDILSHNGEFFYGAVRKRYESQGGMSLYSEVVDEIEVLDMAKQIVHFLRLSFINNIQLKKDNKGKLKILEINPRIPGNIGLSLKASSNMIADAIKLAFGEKIDIPKKIKFGLIGLKYYEDLYLEKDKLMSTERIKNGI